MNGSTTNDNNNMPRGRANNNNNNQFLLYIGYDEYFLMEAVIDIGEPYDYYYY